MPDYLNLLKNHIDITRIPFSDRGSRLLVFQHPARSRLLVKLAERLTGLEPDIEAYLKRPPFIRELALLDGDGNPLDFTVQSNPHQLRLITHLGDFGLAFQDRRTLSIGLPRRQAAGLRFHVSPQYWQPGVSGGVFKAIRNVAYTALGQVLRNVIIPTEGGYSVDLYLAPGDDNTVAINIYPPDSAPTLDALPYPAAQLAAELRWKEWFERIPPVLEQYEQTYAYAWWIMGNNLISPQGNVAYESMMPSKIKYVGLWLWDSAMHALAYRHVDADLARNQIRALLAQQLPNGMLPDAIYDEGIVSTIDHPIVGEVTKPPILAWAAMKLHEVDPSPSFLQEIYVPLVRLYSWWFTMNDGDGDGLAEYTHPYSSGLDDSPLWDYGMPVESPDLNTYLCLQMRSLAQIAEVLGMQTEASMWRRRSAALVKRMIEDFWDEETGLFWALHNEERIPVVTPFNLYPLWTGQLPQHIQRRLVEHLTDPVEFWSTWPLATVSRSDPHYDPETMWRGPVWANINYFFVEALTLVGETEWAQRLREKTLELIGQHASIYEYYNPETGAPPPASADIFGWTSAVYIDLAIQASREAEAQGNLQHGNT